MLQRIAIPDPFERKRQRLAAGAKPRVFDVCGGAGGFSLGFAKAGFQLIGAVETDPIAAATYADNLHKTASAKHRKVLASPRDLLTTSPARVAKELNLGATEDAIDIILAGLPCQAFARIGRPKLGSLAENPAAYRSDPRASLYRRFLKYVRALKPLSIILENVPDILNHGGHNVPEEISRNLEKAGYICRYTLLNAACYGVPQFRERLFLIAHHHTVGEIPKFPLRTHKVDFPSGYTGVRVFALSHVDPKRSHYVETPALAGSVRAVSIQEALRDLPAVYRKHWRRSETVPDRRITVLTAYSGSPSSYGLSMRQWGSFTTGSTVTAHAVRHTPRDYRHFSAMRHGEQYPKMHDRAMRRFQKLLARRSEQGRPLRKNSKSWRHLRDSIVPPYDPTKFPNKWRKLEPDRPSCTLTAHLGKDSYSHIHYDSAQGRTISVREAARLQSFPDGFIFCGSMNSAFKQIGNAVPPLLAYAIAVEVARALGNMNTNAVIANRKVA